MPMQSVTSPNRFIAGLCEESPYAHLVDSTLALHRRWCRGDVCVHILASITLAAMLYSNLVAINVIGELLRLWRGFEVARCLAPVPVTLILFNLDYTDWRSACGRGHADEATRLAVSYILCSVLLFAAAGSAILLT
jgi:hypothetical protein